MLSIGYFFVDGMIFVTDPIFANRDFLLTILEIHQLDLDFVVLIQAARSRRRR